MYKYSRRISSAVPDARSLRLTAGRAFQERNDVDSRSPLLHVILVGQEDESSNELVSSLSRAVQNELSSECESRFNVSPHLMDMRVGASLPSHEEFRHLLSSLQELGAVCTQQFFYFVLIMTDAATKARVPPVLPAVFFDKLNKFDERLSKKYQLDTNSVPAQYELNKAAMNTIGEEETLSQLLQRAYQATYTSSNTDHVKLLISDIGLQFEQLLCEDNVKERCIAIITAKSRFQPIATYSVLKEMVLSRLASRSVFSLCTKDLDVSTATSIKHALSAMITKDMDTVKKVAPNTTVVQSLHRTIYDQLHSWYTGRHSHVKRVMNYMKTHGTKSPLIVYGGCGYGKSALLAHCVKKLENEAGKLSIVVKRHVGLSDNSRTVDELFLSVVSELSEYLPSIDNSLSFGKQSHPADMMAYALSIIGNAASKKNKRVVLVFDNVAELEPVDRVVQWIPPSLPASVSLVLCMDSSANGTLDRILETLAPGTEFLLRVDTLPEEEAVSICQLHCSHNRCKLSRDQINSISNAFFQCRQVAYLRMILQHSMSWSSFNNVHTLRIGRTVRLAIQVLFEDLDLQLGVQFTSIMLGLFACAKDGLRLDELFLIAHMDARAGVHTSLQLLRLLQKLQQYLLTKYIHRSMLIVFTSSEFIYVIRKRYLTNESKRRRIHNILASFFMKSSQLFKKPTCEEKKAKTNPLGASRNSACVPANATVHSSNLLRTLSELPHHLMLAHRLPELMAICCNIKWMWLKLSMLSVHELQQDLHDAGEHTANKDICQIRDAVTSVLHTFNRTSANARHNFCNSILCRLKDVQGTITVSPSPAVTCLSMFIASVEALLEDKNSDVPRLTSLNAWTPCDSMTVTDISGGCRVTCMCISEDQDHLIVAGAGAMVQLRSLPEGKLLQVWHLEGTGSVQEAFFNQKSDKILCKLPSRFAVLDIRSGDVVKDISLASGFTFEHLSLGYLLCLSKHAVELVHLQTDEVSHTWHTRDNVTATYTCACLARPEEAFVFSDDGEMAIIDLELEKVIQDNGSANTGELGPCIIAGTDAGFIQVWALQTSSVVKGFDAHTRGITFVEALSDYKVLSVSQHRGIRIHNWRNGRLLHRSPIAAVAGEPSSYNIKVDPGENFVAVAGGYHIFVWSLQGLIPTKVLFCHSAPVLDLQITDLDENVWRLVSSGEDGLCRVWSIEDQTELAQFQLASSSSIIKSKGSLVLTAEKENITVYKYSSTSLPNPSRYTRSVHTAVVGGEDYAYVCELGPDEHCVIVRSGLDGSLLGCKHNEETVMVMGFCSSGTSVLLYVYSEGHSMSLYDVPSMKETNRFFMRDTICRIDSHPESVLVACLTSLGHLLLYNASTCSLEAVRGIAPFPTVIQSQMVAFTKHLLYVSQQIKVYVIDVASGVIVHDRCLSNQKPVAMTYCPARQHFVHSIGGPSVWLLDLDNYTKAYKLSTSLRGNITELECVDDLLLAADSAGYVTVMDAMTGSSLCSYHMEGSIECLAVNGNVLAMLVDGHVARLLLQRGRGNVIRKLENDFVQDMWRAVHNTLGCGDTMHAQGYLGFSAHERLQWGLDFSPLPAQCCVL